MMNRRTIKLVYRGTVNSKKNSKVIRYNHRTGQRFITSNAAAKRNELDMICQFGEQINKKKWFRAEDFSPCAVSFYFYEPDRKRRDLDNQITSVLDALVKARVLEDDNTTTVRMITAYVVGFGYKEPMVEVIIERLNAGYDGTICYPAMPRVEAINDNKEAKWE